MVVYLTFSMLGKNEGKPERVLKDKNGKKYFKSAGKTYYLEAYINKKGEVVGPTASQTIRDQYIANYGPITPPST